MPPYTHKRIYFNDGMICTDFDNIVCRDLSTGEEVFSTPDDYKNGTLMQKAKNDMLAASKAAYPSIFNDDFVFETTYLIKGIAMGGLQSSVRKFDMAKDKM